MSVELQLREISDKLKVFSLTTSDHIATITELITELKSIPCTPADVKSCGLHLTINSLKKDPNTAISDAAKEIINHWRSAASPSQTAPSVSSSTTPATTTKTTESTQSEEKDPNLLVQIEKPSPIISSPPQSHFLDKDEVAKRKLPVEHILGATGSKGRDGVQKLFYNVFDNPRLHNGIRCELAVTIEEALFKHFLGENQEYKDRVRLLLANLKDKKNEDFMESIIEGELLPRDLPTLSQANMASKSVQKSLNAAADYQLEARKTDLGGGKGVDMFPCPKCKARNTSFFQKQTRSADEPMTIFCTCLECRAKWRIY